MLSRCGRTKFQGGVVLCIKMNFVVSVYNIKRVTFAANEFFLVTLNFGSDVLRFSFSCYQIVVGSLCWVAVHHVGLRKGRLLLC